MIPTPEDKDSWLAFEEVYEDAMDKIRRITIQVKGRQLRQLYGARVINPKLQTSRERTTESLLQRQSAQLQLRKVKTFLERIALEEDSEDIRSEPQRNRQYIEWTQKLAPILDKIPEEKRRECFGDDLTNESIWNMLNTPLEHRQRVIEWLDTLIVSELDGELKEMAGKLHAQRVQEAINTTKSIAMKQYIDKKHSPACAIDKRDIHRFFQKTWATPTQDFEEALADSPSSSNKRSQMTNQMQ
jgi:hypothetical protein